MKYFLFVLFIAISTINKVEAGGKYLYVAGFDSNKVDSFPSGWRGRSKDAKKFYKVRKEGSLKNQYLEAKVVNSDELIIKKKKVNIVEYPYLNWKWRIHMLPPGGDESIKSKCDVPASMNVILEADKTLGIPTPKTLKYSWSTTLKKGTITKSPYAMWPARCDIVVLQSGEQYKGKWVTEKRNVLKDYLKFYKKDKVDQFYIDGIVIMSDSDNTTSTAWADYDSIYFSRN